MRVPLLCATVLAAAVALSLTTPAFAGDPTFADESVPATAGPADGPVDERSSATLAAPAPQADTPSGDPGAARETEKYWYGYQTLIVDAASIGSMLLGSTTPAFGYIGVGGYVVGPAFVHAANKNGVGAGLSIVTRVTLPLVGGFVGYAAAGNCTERPNENQFLGPCFLHGFGEMILGGVIGATLAITIDAAAIARGERPVERKGFDGRPRVTGVAPSYDPRTGSAGVGLGGTF